MEREKSHRYRMPEKAKERQAQELKGRFAKYLAKPKPRLSVVPKSQPSWWPLIAIALILVMAWRFWPKK